MHIIQVISVFLALCFAAGSFDSSPAVKQQTNGINQLTFQNVNIPVYFPTFLPAVHSEDGESTEYLFAVTTSSETYDIEIYDISSQDFTDDKPDIARLPLSCKVGSIHGSHYLKFDLDIALPFEHFCNPVDIRCERTDNADACNVIDVVYHVVNG